MQRCLSTFLSLVAYSTLSSHAATPATEGALQPMQFLVGSCWRGTFPDGKSVDTHCFEPVYGQFIRDRHIVLRDGADYCGESVYWRDAGTKAVTYLYFNSDGGTSTGTMSASGARLQFADEVYTAPDGKVQKLRTAWQREGKDTYVSTTEQEQQGAWQVLWKIHFTRMPQQAAAEASRRATQCSD